jgi:RNA recognition motif-containing protein|mmetsp:Transcript_93367/g.145679  ORF Transcript_93367/g.145679 Transcript_93367/m.145679 type:complete len:281 (+) Transcript_93367:66-908(+)
MVSRCEYRSFDEDAQDYDHLSPREEERHDEEEMGSANINSYQTASFWDDRELPEASEFTSQDQPTAQSVWVAFPAVSIPTVPVAACTSAYPTADAEELMQKAKDLTEKAEKLEAEARRLKGSHATRTPQANMADSSTDRTTVMLRNIPNNLTRAGLLDLLESRGFPTVCFNFLYLPMDFRRDANLGYAFVNLTSAHDADRFFQVFQGFQGWGCASGKIGEVCWGEPLQGLDKHIDRYRNSPVMHSNVPEEHKPLLFRDGMRIPFPEPTKKIRAPRAPARI